MWSMYLFRPVITNYWIPQMREDLESYKVLRDGLGWVSLFYETSWQEEK